MKILHHQHLPALWVFQKHSGWEQRTVCLFMIVNRILSCGPGSWERGGPEPRGTSQDEMLCRHQVKLDAVLFHRQRKDNSESVISFQTNAACVRIGSACSDQVLSGVVGSGSVSGWSLSRPPPSEHVQSVNYNSTRASSHVKFPHISSGCILVGRNRFSEQSQLVWVQNLSWRRRFCRGCNVGCVHLWVFLSAGDCEAFLIICVVFPSPCSPFLEGYFSECSLRSPYTRNPSGLNFCDNAVSLLLSVAISRPRCVGTTAPSWTCRGRHCRGMMSTPPPLSASLIRPNLI